MGWADLHRQSQHLVIGEPVRGQGNVRGGQVLSVILPSPDGEDNQATTGYAYQPWHLRYLDHDLIRDTQDAAPTDPKVDTMEEVSGLESARTGQLSAG